MKTYTQTGNDKPVYTVYLNGEVINQGFDLDELLSQYHDKQFTIIKED